MGESALFKTDLHLHSTCSDGVYTPSRLVEEVEKAGVNAFALTDHETLAGIMEAGQTAQERGLTFIPGVEINTAGEEEIHLLLYHVRPDMKGLMEMLAAISEDRRARAYRFIVKLGTLGIDMAIGDFQIPEGTDCNRPLVAKALVRKGHAASVPEAFDRYLGVGKKAYVPRLRFETEEVIRLAAHEGAVPVLAHPGLIKSPALKSEAAIRSLASAGLKGIEAYHSKHSPAASKYWDSLARGLGLMVTGGSDFHEPHDSHGPIGSQAALWENMQSDTLALLALGKR